MFVYPAQPSIYLISLLTAVLSAVSETARLELVQSTREKVQYRKRPWCWLEVSNDTSGEKGEEVTFSPQ